MREGLLGCKVQGARFKGVHPQVNVVLQNPHARRLQVHGRRLTIKVTFAFRRRIPSASQVCGMNVASSPPVDRENNAFC